MPHWETITKFGDATMMAPAAAGIALWLTLARKRRLAFIWCLLFAAAMSLVALTKIAFMGWGIGESFNFTGISGHAASACAVFPVMAFLLLQQTRSLFSAYGVAIGAIFGLAIGVSRVVIDAHSVPEVIAGCVLGFVVSAGLIAFATPLDRPKASRPIVALCMLALFGFSFTAKAPTQFWLERIAVAISGRDQPLVRKKSPKTALKQQKISM